MPRSGRNGIFASRTLGTMFLSLVFVIVLPTCFLILLNGRQLQDNFRQRAQDAQLALLEKTADTYDRDLNELGNDLILLGTDNDLIRIALVKEIGIAQQDHLLRVLKRIDSISYTHKAAEQVNVYLRKPNKMYYAGVNDVDRFVKRFASPGSEDTFLSQQYRMSLSLVFDREEKRQRILLSHSIPLGGAYGSIPIVQAYTFLSDSEILYALSDASMYSQSLVTMCGENGTQFSHIGDAGLVKALLESPGILDKESGETRLGGKPYWYVVKRGTSGIMYLTATPEDIIFADMKKLSGQTALNLILVLVLGTLTAFFLSKVSERPVRQLFNMITNRKRDHTSVSDRVRYIQTEITGLYSENDSLRQAISKTQMEAERDRLLYRLLMGLSKYQSLPSMVDVCTPLVAVCIRLEQQTENVVHYASQSNIWAALRQYALQNHFLCAQLTSRVMVMVCSNMEEAKAAAAMAKAFVQPYLEMTGLRIGVGGIMDDPDSISVSYRQAMDMLDYRGDGAVGHVCYYDDAVQRSEELHYPVERENQIINLLVSGSVHEAVSHFAGVFQENVNRGISEPMRNILCKEFTLTLLRATNAIGALSPVAPKLYDEVRQYVLLDSQAIGHQQYLDGLYRLCGILSDFVSARSKDQELTLQIRTYIHDHIHEEISLESIASRFGYAPAYFSRYFKKNLGVNPKEYITRERMRIAKSLLIHSTDEIQTISNRVGFQNANSFARTFRQYEGISPSLYRDKQKQAGSDSDGQSQT